MPVAKPDDIESTYRRFPVWPFSGIRSEWINKKDPNYEKEGSIFQGSEGGIDPTGSGIIKKVATPARRWYSQLQKALASPRFQQAERMRGNTILKNLRKQGVSNEELRWTGVEDTLTEAGHADVNIASVRNMAEYNKIKLIDRNLKEGTRVPKQLYELGTKISKKKWNLIDKLGMFHQPEFTNTQFKDLLARPGVIRLDPADQEMAKAEFRSRIDFFNTSKKDALKHREEYIRVTDLEDRIDSKISSYSAKRKPHHYNAYLKDKPLPPGEDYQQWLIELKHSGTPRPGGMHYPGQKNIVVGLAVDKRTTMEGKVGRHMHEGQSDWGLDIRKHGVEPKINPETAKQMEQLKKQYKDAYTDWSNSNAKQTEYWDVYSAVKEHHESQGNDPWLQRDFKHARNKWSTQQQEGDALYKTYTDMRKAHDDLSNTIPAKKFGQQSDMPFKDTAAMKLGLKKALYEAAKEGVDVFTWSTGKHVAERWGQTHKKWPYEVYDKFTPDTIKSLGKELGVKVQPREMKYPRRDYKQEVLKDGIDYDMRHLEEVRGRGTLNMDLIERLESRIKTRTKKLKQIKEGHSVWGVDMTPEFVDKILEKGFKTSKVAKPRTEALA